MKKKSSLIVVCLLLILTGVSLYLYKSKSRLSTVYEDARNFKFKDTAAITHIFIADKDGHQSDLNRTKEGWAVKDMSAQAIKVEIYTGDKLVRQYYVGYETEDSEGSYMLLTDVESGENYSDPSVCFIAGFKGFLLPRYIANESEWRNRLVINYIPPKLKEVRVQHHDAAPDSSFSIELANANQFKLKNGRGIEIPFDDAKMRQYLVYLQNVSYEVLITGKNKKLQDSLRAVKPFVSMHITTTDLKT